MNTYQPAVMDFFDAEERQQEGNRHIAQADGDAGLTIDAVDLFNGGTLALCALIEWRRTAQQHNCRLFFANIPPRLQKLIGVYQLDKLIYEGECRPIVETAPPAEFAV